MRHLKPLPGTGLKYDHIIATGGIGSGIFFSLNGNQSLGRNESRMATLLPYSDFCKQHIIMHYVAVLLGASINGPFKSFPIGKVGKDEVGINLIKQMNSVGMNTQHVTVSETHRTLFSVCYQYPDKAGGNITTDNSACGDVSPEDISRFFDDFRHVGNSGIILAAPEVPLATRLKLLEYGRKRKSFNMASIQSSEVNDCRRMNFFGLIDLLSINIDEARSIANITDESVQGEIIIEACITVLTALNPSITLLITDGANGNYCYERGQLRFTPAMHVPVTSTAGAGDAFLAGTTAGLCAGLPLIKNNKDRAFSETPLETAVELGTLLASMSVTSNDTIHPTANTETLYGFAKENAITFGPDFSRLF
jgi:sugar/nucleoside kinase (ribokinase family)